MVSIGHFLAMDGGEVRPSAKEVAAVAQQWIANCLITKTFEIRSEKQRFAKELELGLY